MRSYTLLLPHLGSLLEPLAFCLLEHRQRLLHQEQIHADLQLIDRSEVLRNILYLFFGM
jgi:hypothetical protein